MRLHVPARPTLWLLAAALFATAATAQPVDPEPPGRSRALPALAVSAGATAGGLALAYAVLRVEALQAGFNDPGPVAFLTAAALGPAAGNLWLGAPRDAAIGTALRALGAGAAAYGIATTDDGLCDDCYDEDGNYTPPESDPNARADALLKAGAVLFVGGVAYDVVTQVRNGAPGRVRLTPAGAGLALRVGL